MFQSEVARLREQIRLEYQAAQRVFIDFTPTAEHEFITKRMEHIQEAHVALQILVGKDEAIKLLAETLENASEVGSHK